MTFSYVLICSDTVHDRHKSIHHQEVGLVAGVCVCACKFTRKDEVAKGVVILPNTLTKQL